MHRYIFRNYYAAAIVIALVAIPLVRSFSFDFDFYDPYEHYLADKKEWEDRQICENPYMNFAEWHAEQERKQGEINEMVADTIVDGVSNHHSWAGNLPEFAEAEKQAQIDRGQD